MALEPSFPEDTYVLASLPNRPPWPGIVCSPKDIPKEYHSRRPHGYFQDKPVLLLHKLEIHWIPTTSLEEIGGWDCPEVLRKLHPGLELAYKAVYDNCFEKFTSAKEWLNLLHIRNDFNGFKPPKSRTAFDSDADPEDEEEADFDLERALKASLEDMGGEKRGRGFATDYSHLDAATPKRRRIKYGIGSLTTTKGWDKISTGNLPTPPNSSKSSPAKSVASERAGSITTPSAEPTSPSPSKCHSAPEKDASLTIEQILARDRAQEAGEDKNLDLEVANSKDFVEFRIGENENSFFIPYNKIENRPYFSGRHLGYLAPKKDGGWLFDRPYLRNISATDFGLVAEFLESESFGINIGKIDSEDQRQECLMECVTAWSIARELMMDDLMELIVRKLRNLPILTLEETLALASQIYREPDDDLPGRQEMKDLLVGILAERFHELVREHQTNLLGRLASIPELELDILKRRVVSLEGAEKRSEGEDEEEDEDKEDEDG